MKQISFLILVLFSLSFFKGCTANNNRTDILATTVPLYEFTTLICQGTGLNVDCLITENVSCLHDYTLQTRQLKAIEASNIVILSGCGLEESFEDLLKNAKNSFDASKGITLLCSNAKHNHNEHDHSSEYDPHIWLSPQNATIMAANIFTELCTQYPEHSSAFQSNYMALQEKFTKLSSYADTQLTDIKTRKLITFHDGFAYMANAFDLEILHAIEEESGREASAAELIYLCEIVREHQIHSIFTEINGSTSAAQIISKETGAKVYQLDMAMSENGYFDAMYHNIDVLKEALG